MSSVKEVDSLEEKKYQLKVSDRCDSCQAQALVQVFGITGDLLFCGHHYNSIMNNPDSYNKMMSFMINIIDERDKLVENRTQNQKASSKHPSKLAFQLKAHQRVFVFERCRLFCSHCIFYAP